MPKGIALKGKLLCIILPALLGLLLVTALQVNRDFQSLREIKTIGVLTDLVTDLTNLGDATVLERVSLFWHIGNTPAPAGTLEPGAAFEKTDAAVAAFRKTVGALDRGVLSAPLNANIDTLFSHLERVPRMREQGRQRTVTQPEMLTSYRLITADVTAIIGEASKMPNNAEISSYFASIYQLLQSQEAVSRGRLPLRLVFEKGGVKGAEKDYVEALQVFARDDAFFETMMLYANPEQRAMADEVRNGTANKEAERYEAIAMTALTAEKLTQEPMAFRNAQHAKLQALTALKNKFVEGMHTVVARHASQTRWRMGTTAAVSAFVLVLVIGFGTVVTRGLLKGTDRIIGELNASSRQTLSASMQVSASSQSLAAGASEQAASIQQVTGTLERISTATKQNAEHATSAEKLAQQAQAHTAAGHAAMARMVEAIQSIKDASDKTAKINKTIDEIAFQTNLLALNAAVEAARAGDAGRGFAVVAEEVRNLAIRSAAAAKDTSALIEDSQQRATQGVAVSEDVRRLLDEIRGAVDEVNGFVQGVASASKEQYDMVTSINAAVVEMEHVIESNAAGAEETAASSEELSSQAESLAGVVQELARMMRGAKAAGNGEISGNGNVQRVALASAQPPGGFVDIPDRHRSN